MSPFDDLLNDSARRSPDRPALVWDGGAWTGRALDSAVGRLADRLSDAVGVGDRIGIVAPNAPATIAGLFATWRLGAVAVPIDPRWRRHELERTLRDAEPNALITVPSHRGYDLAGLVADLRPSVPTLRPVLVVDPSGEPACETTGDPRAVPTDPLDPRVGLLLYTSGTTGAPKGVPVSGASEAASARTLNDVLGAGPGDVVVQVAPISHRFGLTCLLAAMAGGCTVVLVDSTFTMGPLVAAIRRHRATILHGSPTLFAGLLKLDGAGPGSLRTGFVAGAPCPPGILERLDAAGLCILNLYGLTEIGAVSCCRPADPPAVRHTTAGSPLPGLAIRIQDDGEVLVHGPQVAWGDFRQQPGPTAAAFHGGWFRTGDLGSIDDRGNLRISGRLKDLILVAGLNVSPAEVEGLLLTHPDVLEVAVVGVPHATIGEVPRAFVVPRPGSGLTPTAVLQYARARIAGYKLPYTITLLPELPRLPSGKPDRAILVRTAMEGTDAVDHRRAHAAL